MTGITAALVTHSNLLGHPDGDLGLFEVDEAHVPTAARALRPRVLALLNVFRDQLDRYGEVDLVATTWRQAVERLGPDATLVLNTDDPIVAWLGRFASGPVLTFGMEQHDTGGPRLPHEADRRLCPSCGRRLDYSWAYYGHVGHYACTGCGWRRPTPDVTMTRLRTDGPGGSEVVLEIGGEQLPVSLPLPGSYNAYNALAAAAISSALHLPSSAIGAGLRSVSAVFGRQEAIAVGDGSIVMTLVKNPAGFNQVISTLAAGEPPDLLVIAINDLFADGTDVSWLWDVDFEELSGQPGRILCTGLRAHDMALRLKYALVADARLDVEPQLDAAVATAIGAAERGARVAILPTYTAMLTMRRALERRGCVAPFWSD
jgi:UDP-N-acetylmuramyl tripeptide synthase